MKLGDWSLHFYRLPYVREIPSAHGAESWGDYALLRLVADSAETGIAEGVIAHSGYSPRSLSVALEDVVLPCLRQVDLLDAKAVQGALAGIPENRLAKALVDNACWTLRAAAAGKPLWQLLGGRQELEMSFTLTRQTPARMAVEAAEACAKYGVRSLNVQGGQGWEIDMRVLKELRAAVGRDIELAVDAEGRYARDEALEYVRALAHAGVALAEDPCPLAPDLAYSALQRDCGLPILVDRSCSSAEDAQLYIGRGARALAAKPARIGFSEARAIGSVAASGRARFACAPYCESALGTLISLQQAAGVQNSLTLPASHSFFLLLKSQVSRLSPQIRGGKAELPNDADLEKFVDWKAIERLKL